MTNTDRQYGQRLEELVEGAHERALHALADPNTAPLEAVTWLAAHLAAVERVIQPAVTRHLPGDRAALRADRQLTARISRTLRMLERHHAGDATASGVNEARLHGQLATLLKEHAARERALIGRLGQALGPQASETLASQYALALQHAPTRPHPHSPHAALLSHLAYRVNALRDHVLDILDSRQVPIPGPPRTSRRIDRWGAYLLGGLGQPSSSEPDDRD